MYLNIIYYDVEIFQVIKEKKKKKKTVVTINLSKFYNLIKYRIGAMKTLYKKIFLGIIKLLKKTTHFIFEKKNTLHDISRN